jgi:hypothetical protein
MYVMLRSSSYMSSVRERRACRRKTCGNGSDLGFRNRIVQCRRALASYLKGPLMIADPLQKQK